MPASITLARVTLSAPDGQPLLSDLDLSFGAERSGLVGRNGVGKTTLLRLIAGELQPVAGTVTRSGRLAMLRQSTQIVAGTSIADLFGVRAELDRQQLALAGRADADAVAALDWTLETRMATALSALGLEAAPDTLLTELSGGQVTRAALAALVFAAPDFLLLDEPTNHLDSVGRAAVRDLLAGWKAGAIVISHDRELLEQMDAIVELTSLGATRYGGGWSRYRSLRDAARDAAVQTLAEAERHVAQVQRAVQATVERQARRNSAGRRKAARGDIPKILIGGRKERSENTGGAQSRLADRQRLAAEQELVAARERLEVLQPFAVTLPSTGLPAGRTVLRLTEVSGGHDPARPLFTGLDLELVGPERVAVTGPNGVGKTTLLAIATGALPPLAGEVVRPVPFVMLDQRMAVLHPELSVAENFARHNPEADITTCRAALARFMFRADAALQLAGTLSGGEMLRAALAAVLGGPRPPQLLILDEPTNHLDIEAVEVVEAGLRGYDGALLVVSHDQTFLDAIGITRRIVLDRSRESSG